MAFSLTVYGNSAFQEIILPEIRDNDFTVVLLRHVFGFQQDASLVFENVGGAWLLSRAGEGTRIRKLSLQPGQSERT